MCGIAGVVGPAADPVSINKMQKRISHRGPDGSWAHVWEEQYAIGHNHLFIRGHQKQPYLYEKYTTVLNGQIYNLKEDVRECTEAFIKKGPSCLHDFEGMFALAIHGPGGLFLARDRLGVRPLYYAEVNGSLYFASEIKAFIDVLDLKVNREIAEFTKQFPQTAEGAEETLLHPVKRLLPGHYLTFKDSKVKVVRWWRPVDHQPERFDTEEFMDRFRWALRVREQADRPIAIALSGGLDSSSVYVESEVKRAYVAMYGENEEQAMALRLAPDAVQVPIKQIPLEPLIYLYEDIARPYPGQVQLYRKMAADGVRVSIEGHGPDEMFGGYAVAQKYLRGKKFTPPHDVAGIFADDDPDASEGIRHLYWTSFCGQLQWILRTYDRAAMASGVETRAPFLDWRLFLLGLFWPKECTDLVKMPLRQMMKHLPQEIRMWPHKRGFSSPKWAKLPYDRALSVLEREFCR